MAPIKRSPVNLITIALFMGLGAVLLVISAFFASSYLAILSLGLFFWGVILIYITPKKHVPLTLLNATNDLRNIERILAEANVTEKGIYLPPRNLKDSESSLVFVPEKPTKNLPDPIETNLKLLGNEKNGLFLTPPGFSLSRLFEKELGYSFTKTDLKQIQSVLPKLLVETMEIAEDAEMEIQGNIVNIEITNSVLDGVCQQTQNLQQTHDQIGCPLTSAIACALAKASGKPVIIQKETENLQTKVTKIEYLIHGE
jgi:hypothetical protein